MVFQRVMRLATLLAGVALVAAEMEGKKHHHKHHHKHHSQEAAKQAPSEAPPASEPAKPAEPGTEEQITGKMKALEAELAKKEAAVKGAVQKGRIEVNGPLPADFAEKFAQAVAKATGCAASEVKVVETSPVVALLQQKGGDVVEVVFEAPADVVKAVEDQAADP